MSEYEKKGPHTLLGWTSDGTPVYWAKKNSDDPDSPDLSLWVSVGGPDPTGENYRRVPPHWESLYMAYCKLACDHKSLKGTDARWGHYVGIAIAGMPTDYILKQWLHAK